MTADPRSFDRRTPLYPILESEGLAWLALRDAAVAEGPPTAVGRLAIADLTPLPRLGFKGRGTIAAMKARGIVLEAQPNRAFRQPDGSLCLVLAASEVVLLAPLSGEGAQIDALEQGYRIEDGESTYPIPRRDGSAWLAVAGEAAPAMFSKICGVDLRLDSFADLAIAQTSVARLNAIVTRADLRSTPVFHLLADSASAAYLLSCLRDAAHEFGGELLGLSALRRLGP